jgi:predicted aldo/keto reductase-like oxidoreductase
VDDFPWEFCQIQYNYLDENFQAGTECMKYAAAKGLGVVAMEPLRGGMLVGRLPAAARELAEGFPIKRTPAEWGLRWVWNHPEISLLLSGMNDEGHIDENMRIASLAAPSSMDEAELSFIASARDAFNASIKVGCTGCAYCMPCPSGVNIPQCFAQYNARAMFGGLVPLVSYFMYLDGYDGPPSKASVCAGCGACERKCPQHLPIMSHLKEVARTMEKGYIGGPLRLGRRIFFR